MLALIGYCSVGFYQFEVLFLYIVLEFFNWTEMLQNSIDYRQFVYGEFDWSKRSVDSWLDGWLTPRRTWEIVHIVVATLNMGAI